MNQWQERRAIRMRLQTAAARLETIKRKPRAERPELYREFFHQLALDSKAYGGWPRKAPRLKVSTAEAAEKVSAPDRQLTLAGIVS